MRSSLNVGMDLVKRNGTQLISMFDYEQPN